MKEVIPETIDPSVSVYVKSITHESAIVECNIKPHQYVKSCTIRYTESGTYKGGSVDIDLTSQHTYVHIEGLKESTLYEVYAIVKGGVNYKSSTTAIFKTTEDFARLEILRKEREALIALYNATGGDNWTNNTNWCLLVDVSKWYGIKVNEQGRVREIDLKKNNLIGAVSGDIMEAFAELSRLYLEENQLSALDVSNNSRLISLECNNNQLKTLNMGRHPQLNTIRCHSNQLTSIDVTNCPELERLEGRNNQLTSLDVSNNPKLKEFSCQQTRITSLDLSNNQQLLVLICHDTNITRLDLSKNLLLDHLNCCATPTLTSLDVSNCVKLTELYCGGCNLTSLDVSKNEQLTKLYCDNNRLPSLDVRNLTKLNELLAGNQRDNIILNLYVTQAQAEKWKKTWSKDNTNKNVLLDWVGPRDNEDVGKNEFNW